MHVMRACYQYLLMLEHVRNDASRGATIDTDVGFDPTLSSTPFGSYSCSYGWRGVEVSEQFIGDTLIQEYKEQKPYLYGMLKGVFGRYWRSDHTRKIAKKVELQTGDVWSYCIQNEYWETVSWVMVGANSDNVLDNCYMGLTKR